MTIYIRDLEKLNKKGVYAIVNTITKKVYIGSTNKSFKNRLMFHINGLKKNSHENKYLQNAYNKYGADKFYFRIMLVCDNVLKWEQRAFDIYKPFNKRGYNINIYSFRPPIITNKEVFSRRSKTFKETINTAISYYYRLKNNDILYQDIPKKYINIVNHYMKSVPWNKGKKLSNEHIEKLKNADRIMSETGLLKRRSRFKELRKKISVYHNNILLGVYSDAQEIVRLSKTENSEIWNNTSLFRSKSGKELKLPNIFQSCRNSKPYKGLVFKYFEPS